MLILFDVDGTLLGGESHDWRSFDRALYQVLGFVHQPGFFDTLSDVSAESIVEAAAISCGIQPTPALSEQVREAYLGNLRETYAAHENPFPARDGAFRLLEELDSIPEVSVGIATGDWRATISFKLQCAGMDLSRFAFASSSDAPRRTEIIKKAAERSGRRLEEAIYIGDGVWDLRACNELAIPFVGTGARIERLKEAGAAHLCEDFSLDTFLQVAKAAAHSANARAALLNARVS